MVTSNIDIKVTLNEEKIPVRIDWRAENSSVNNYQEAKAMMLSFWDGGEKTALRMDLWNKDMMMDEMADFFYQNMVTMADTFNRATHLESLSTDIKSFANLFMKKFKESQQQNNKLG
jgi:gliding motility-associated protein GldC